MVRSWNAVFIDWIHALQGLQGGIRRVPAVALCGAVRKNPNAEYERG